MRNREKEIKKLVFSLTLLVVILFIISFVLIYWAVGIMYKEIHPILVPVTIHKTLLPLVDQNENFSSGNTEISILEKEGIIPPSSGLKQDSTLNQKKVLYEISAYNSVPWQTDDSPCISADNKNICERYLAGQKLCASNNFRLGSEVYIEGYGKCKIADRMNKRYQGNYVDIYMGMDIARARQFGRQKMLITTR